MHAEFDVVEVLTSCKFKKIALSLQLDAAQASSTTSYGLCGSTIRVSLQVNPGTQLPVSGLSPRLNVFSGLTKLRW